MELVKQSLKRSPLATSLPLYLTRLVGRESEQATLSKLLLQKRLLTLVGAGGIGKTRLALQIATEPGASFPDGVYWIELASLSEPQLVPQALASALNIPSNQDTSIHALLLLALQERHCLLILDNCEHVLTACTPLVETLLSACPHLHILATSREPLHAVEETVWHLAALSFPHTEQRPTLEQLTHYEACQLFCERAADIDPDFRLTAQNAPAITRICQHLDGLPLALELAAARLSTLSVNQLADRLSERFVLLTDGGRIVDTKQRTLQATLDWSYALLTSTEQALFQHLAVFAGSWDLAAAEQIMSTVSSEANTTAHTLTQLVNKSLIIAEEQEEQETGARGVRYRLFDTIHQYALEKLQQAADWSLVCMRHHSWYLHLAEQAKQHLHGAEQLVWLHRMEMEMPNIRVALTRALATGRTDAAAQLAIALCSFWIIHNHFSEGRHWFDTLLAVEQDSQQLSPARRTQVLFGAAEFARYQGAYGRTCVLLEEQITLCKQLDDPFGLAEAQSYLGTVLGLQGNYELAKQLCQTSLDFYHNTNQLQIKSNRGRTAALTMLSFIALSQGKYLHAITLSEETCQLLRETGDYSHLLYGLFTLAQATILQGDIERSRTTCREALDLAQKLQQMYGLASCLGLIAGIAGLTEQSAQAARLFGAAHALQERMQAPHPPTGRALQERMLLTIRTALGKEQFSSHYSAGQDCPLEEMLAEAEAVLQTASAAATSATSTDAGFSLTADAFTQLSRREREILSLVASGLTNAQIAEHLLLSPQTVGKHMQSIYAKLNINSRSAATRLALEHGFIPIDIQTRVRVPSNNAARATHSSPSDEPPDEKRFS